jgi:hypothetical protein
MNGLHQEKMTFSYIRSCNINPDKKVTGIVFSISRHGNHTHRIDFAEPIPIDNAIYVVERFLSVPLDDKYWEAILDGMIIKDRRYFDTRGDCLGDLRYLESLREIEPDVVMIRCGS